MVHVRKFVVYLITLALLSQAGVFSLYAEPTRSALPNVGLFQEEAVCRALDWSEHPWFRHGSEIRRLIKQLPTVERERFRSALIEAARIVEVFRQKYPLEAVGMAPNDSERGKGTMPLHNIPQERVWIKNYRTNFAAMDHDVGTPLTRIVNGLPLFMDLVDQLQPIPELRDRVAGMCRAAMTNYHLWLNTVPPASFRRINIEEIKTNLATAASMSIAALEEILSFIDGDLTMFLNQWSISLDNFPAVTQDFRVAKNSHLEFLERNRQEEVSEESLRDLEQALVRVLKREFLIYSRDLTRNALDWMRGFVLTLDQEAVGNPEEVDVNQEIASKRGIFNITAKPWLKLEFQLTPRLPPVWIDPALFVRVLFNMIKNARNANNKIGQRNVRLALRTRLVQRLDSRNRLVKKYVCIEISDAGPGIPRDALDDPEGFRKTMWKRGVTGDPDRGRGIGLALSQQVIEAAGGWISMRSSVTDTPKRSRGTTFLIYLPVLESHPPIRQAVRGEVARLRSQLLAFRGLDDILPSSRDTSISQDTVRTILEKIEQWLIVLRGKDADVITVLGGREGVIGTTDLNIIHRYGLLHRAVSAFVQMPNGAYLFPLRAPHMYQPDTLSLISTHVPPGWSYEQAIRQELLIDLGIPHDVGLTGRLAQIGADGEFSSPQDEPLNQERRSVFVYQVHPNESPYIEARIHELDGMRNRLGQGAFAEALFELEASGSPLGKISDFFRLSIAQLEMIASRETINTGPNSSAQDLVNASGEAVSTAVSLNPDLLSPLLHDPRIQEVIKNLTTRQITSDQAHQRVVHEQA